MVSVHLSVSAYSTAAKFAAVEYGLDWPAGDIDQLLHSILECSVQQ